MSNTPSSERSVFEQCTVFINHLDVVSQRYSNVLLESGLFHDLEGIALDLNLWRAEVFDAQEQDLDVSQELAAFMLAQFALADGVLDDIEMLIVSSSADQNDTEDQDEPAETELSKILSETPDVLYQPIAETLHSREPLAIAVRDLQQTARNITDLTDTIQYSRIALSGQQQSNVKVIEATREEINKGATVQTSEHADQALTSKANLGSAYSDQWRWKKAEELEVVGLQAATAGGDAEIGKLPLEKNADVDDQGGLDDLSFVGENERPIFATGLSNITVNFTTERRAQPCRCELQLFSSFEHDIANRTLTLILRYGEQNRRMVVVSSASAHSLSFVPISYFDPSANIADVFGAGIQCRVNGLNDRTTLHFPHAREYWLFQTALTYQQACLDRDVRGIGIKFHSISVRTARTGLRNDLVYGAGHAQVLYQVSDKEYQSWVLDKASTASVTSSRSRDPMDTHRTRSIGKGADIPTSPTSGSLSKSDSTYHLALYTTSVANPPKRTCIVYNLDRHNCIPQTQPQKDDRRIMFRENFPAAIFESPDDISKNSASSYPGYPVIPGLLRKATSDRRSKAGRRSGRIELTMSTTQDCEDLMDIIKRSYYDMS